MIWCDCDSDRKFMRTVNDFNSDQMYIKCETISMVIQCLYDIVSMMIEYLWIMWNYELHMIML